MTRNFDFPANKSAFFIKFPVIDLLRTKAKIHFSKNFMTLCSSWSDNFDDIASVVSQYAKLVEVNFHPLVYRESLFLIYYSMFNRVDEF